MHLDKSIVIRAPPGRVFPWLSPARMARWDKSLVRARLEGPLEPGARFDRVSRELGQRFAMDAEATEVEPDRRFAWRQVRGDFARHEGMYLLEALPEGTLVRLMAEVDFPYTLPTEAPVPEEELQRALSREADDALFNLKELAEAGR